MRPLTSIVVIGVGGSADDLDALHSFFESFPARSGLAFVIVRRDGARAGERPLSLRSGALRVTEAEQECALEANRVYEIAPDCTPTFEPASVRVRRAGAGRDARRSIDRAFRSVADALRERAVAVVLSGIGTDGTLGARAVKAAGGLVVAQAPESAPHRSMPASVIATGCADAVRRPADMAKTILSYAREARHGRAAVFEKGHETSDTGLTAILALLRARARCDFRPYRKSMLQRRIARRMTMHQLDRPGAYLELLRTDPAEIDRLVKDLLIGVTAFFRDRQAFAALTSNVLAPLVRERGADAPIRIWVPACSTGEEAYSIAIALAEQRTATGSACRVQIFATDLVAGAVQTARAGSYPESISLDVDPERLRRFFTRQDHRYTIAKSLRESIVFSVHDLTSDPPFSKLDLISCRNLLIYFDRATQDKLLSIFHFALRAGGFLFLGRAESVGGTGLFKPVAKARGVYQRTGPMARLPAGFSLRTAPGPGRLGAPADAERLEGSRESIRAGRLGGKPSGTPRAQPQQIEPGHNREKSKIVSEEVLSMNEELQSANEELATSKEELQMLNEELTRLNTRLREQLRELACVNDDLVSLLASTDIATVLVDANLRIQRFTSAASAPFNLRQGDVGRPFDDLVSNLVGVDVTQDARSTLDTLEPIERQVASRNGLQYLMRVLPYRSAGQAVKGAVVTLVEVTALAAAERELRAARLNLEHELTQMTRLHELSSGLARGDSLSSLLDRIARAAVDITGADGASLQLIEQPATLTLAAHYGFEQGALDAFRVLHADARTPYSAALAAGRRVLFEELPRDGGSLDADASKTLARAGVRAVQSTPLLDRSRQAIGMLSTHYRTPHTFPEVEQRWVDLLARHAGDVIERQRADEQLAAAQRDLERRVEERTRWLSLVHDSARVINEAPTWDDAVQQVLRQVCASEQWQLGYVYLPQADDAETIAPVVTCIDDRLRPFHLAAEGRRFARGESLPGRVYADGVPFWSDSATQLLAALPHRAAAAQQAGLRACAALPIAIQGKVIGVLELFSDQSHAGSDQRATLLHDIGDQISRVIERERSTTQMADLVWREQQNLVHTLHDSLGQTLTGLGMLSAGLRERVKPISGAAAETADEIVRQAQEALDQVRGLARSLFPIEVDAGSLMAALRALGTTCESLHKVRVQVTGELSPGLHNGKTATELYRIAQEAVTNCVRHAQASTVTIRLESHPGTVTMQIADDGIGIAEAPANSGMGLRIMRQRAASIGASLAVERASPKGTLVTCTLRQPPADERGQP